MDRLFKILKWSEKYTKTDMTYLAKGGSWLFGGQVINFGLAFVQLWVFANLLPKEVYGQYRFLLTALTLLSLTALPGMGIALVRAAATNALGSVRQVIKTQMLFGLLGTAGSLLVAGYYWYNDDSTLSIAFIIIGLFIPLMGSAMSYDSYLNGLQDFRLISILHTAQRILVVSSVVVVIYLSQNVLLIFATYVFTTTLSFWVAYYISTKKYPPNEIVDESAIPYGKQLSIMSGLRTGVQHLDKVALWYLAGPVQVAQLVVASAIPNELSSAVGHISKLALPKLSNRTKAEMQQSLLRKVFIYFIAMVCLAVLYIAAAPYLFTWFLPQYLDSIFFSQVSALLILAAPLGLFSQYFYATKHTRALYTMHTVEPFVLLAGYAILIPLYGVIGVIVASLVRFVFLMIALLFFFLRDRAE